MTSVLCKSPHLSHITPNWGDYSATRRTTWCWRRRSLPALLLAFLYFALALNSDAADKLSDPAVGTTDATGKLIIHVFEAESKDHLAVHLSTAYGVMMFRADDGWCRFTLAARNTNSVREFTNYNAFLEALSELPRGSTLCIYDRCLMPLFYDFYPVHAELYQKFVRECRKRGLSIAKEPKITCTCTAVESK